jgi:hypothetical protein
MRKAKLNCIEKTIELDYRKETIVIDLTQGDLNNSWNNIKLKNKTFTTEFNWDEDSDDSEPTLTIYRNKKNEIGDELITLDCDIVNGTKQDYFNE